MVLLVLSVVLYFVFPIQKLIPLPYTYLGILLILLMELLFIPIEEKNLEQVFGTEYRDYKKKVRRWI